MLSASDEMRLKVKGQFRRKTLAYSAEKLECSPSGRDFSKQMQEKAPILICV